MSSELVSREEALQLAAAATGTWWMDDERRLAETVVALHDNVEQLNQTVLALLGPGLTADEFRAKYLPDAACGQAIHSIGRGRLHCSQPHGHEGPHSDGQAHWTRIAGESG